MLTVSAVSVNAGPKRLGVETSLCVFARLVVCWCMMAGLFSTTGV